MTPQRIDLNSDLGESLGNWKLGDDEAMLDVVTSANVACGFHAGDSLTLQRTCARAAERGVVVGAQVGYRDLAGFGRRFIDMEAAELTADVIYQIGALEAMCRVAGVRRRVRQAARRPLQRDRPPRGAGGRRRRPPSSPSTRACTSWACRGRPSCASPQEAGLRTVAEAFADRAYTPEGHLVSRREPGAVLHDPAVVAARMVRLATEGRITAVDGTEIEVRADSICIHGDSPGAVEMARAVRTALTGAGIEIAPFVEVGPMPDARADHRPEPAAAADG